ncbi:MAG: hypothetical protein IKB10_01985 [Alphaproteobacteria bacterium]|nr:hypothetical protein [Alphaproteobacteria bacterium]
MKKFIICGVSLIALDVISNAYAADVLMGYVCDPETAMAYTSCKDGYYLSGTSCIACPSLEEIFGDRADELEQHFEYVTDLNLFQGAAKCGLRQISDFEIDNGDVFMGQEYPLECAVITDQADEEFTGLRSDTYVCMSDGHEPAVECDAGFAVLNPDLGQGNTLGTSYNLYLANDRETLVIQDVSALKCETVPAGYYSGAGDYVQHVCKDTTIEGVAAGRYCVEGSAEPALCPKKATVECSDGSTGTDVYGITGKDGASAATECYLPAQSGVCYENTIGVYELVESCQYGPIGGSSLDMGMDAQ